MTVTDPIPPPAPAPPVPPAPRAGRLVAGILLVLLGTGWLLEVLGVTEFPWDVVLPAALILVGIALLVVATRGGSQAGLITTGIVLTILLLLGTAFDLPFGGGIGERYEHPTTVEGLGSEYRLGVGRLTLDLTAIDLDRYATTHPIPAVHARVGVGQLVVIVPDGALISAVGRAGLGSVQIFDEEDSGFDAGVDAGGQRGGVDLELTVSVGLGNVEVRYG